MIEVLKQALEALELVSTEFVCDGAHHAKKDRHELGEPCPIVERYEEAITSLRQAIAELESQEPVAHCTVRPLRGDESYPKTEILWVKGKPIAGPLYTHPPQRTWVEVTDEEIKAVRHSFAVGSIDDLHSFARAILNKSKEKNT